MGIAGLLHTDFLVRDLTASIDFYVEKLGGDLVEDTVLTGECVAQLVGRGDGEVRVVLVQFAPRMMIELQQILSPAPHFATTRDTVRPGIVSVAFLVTSIDDVLEDLSKSGVTAVGTPSRVDLPRHGSSRIAFVRDPDGNLIELVEPIRGADAPPP